MSFSNKFYNLYLSLFIITIYIFLYSSVVFADSQIEGEIININYDSQIAYTDLNNFHISQGDIIAVYNGSDFITYLEVSETSSAISKLILAKNRGGFNTTVNFNDIKIGNKVFQVSKDPDKAQKPYISPAVTNIPQEAYYLSNHMDNKIENKNKKSNSRESVILKYNELISKHTNIVKSLITIKAEKKLLESNNQLLANKLKIIEEENKNLKMHLLNMQRNRSEDGSKKMSDNDTCPSELEKTLYAMRVLQDKLRNLKKHIEGKK